MAQERSYGVNWEPYREEILDLYVKQKKTAKATVQHLQERHGLQVTLRQFKFEFGGYKNLSAADWTDTILPAIRKRSRDGSESDVYFRGELLCPKRVRREQVRYLSSLPNDMSVVGTPQGFGTSLEDRICIRTPLTSTPLMSNPEESALDSIVVGDNVAEAAGLSPTIQQAPNLNPTSPSLSPVFVGDTAFRRLFPLMTQNSTFAIETSADGPSDLGMSGGFVLDFDQELDIPLDWFAQLDGLTLGLDSSKPPSPESHLSPLVQFYNNGLASRPESPFAPRLLSFDIARFHLFWNLPWFRLQDLVTTTSFGFSSLNIPGSASLIGAAANRSPSSDESRPLDVIPMLSNFIGLSASSRVATKSTVATRLRELIPARVSAGNESVAQIPLDEPQRPPIIQIFELAAFMVSNNKLSNDHLDTLVKWVIDHGQESALKRFLGLDIAATKVMGPRLMEAGARLRQKGFVTKLSAAGILFDHAAEPLVKIDDPDFRAFVLSRMAPESLSGGLGGKLLLEVVAAKDISNAKLLIQAGAGVNSYVRRIKHSPSTPLLEAVRSGSLELVELLVTSGADVNAYMYGSNPTRINALTAAVTCGYTSIAKYLLDHGAAIEVLLSGVAIVDYADRHGPEMLDMLKAAGATIVTTVNDILSAASKGEVLSEFLSKHCVSPETAKEALKMALKKDMTKEAINLIQQGALHACSQALQVVVESELCPTKTAMFTKLQIREGADPNVSGLLDPLLWEEGWQDGQADVVINVLIDAGFNLRQHGPDAVEKALTYYVEDAAWLLIERGTCLNSYGQHLTPLQAAAWKGSLRLLKSLVDRGAEINQQAYPYRGLTALQGASLNKSLKKTQFLVDFGAELDASAAMTDGTTALETAVRPEIFILEYEFDSHDGEYSENDAATEVFRFLLSMGASVNREDGSHSPLLHDLIERGLTGLLKEALDARASPNQWWGTKSSAYCARTPLQLAAERGDLESVKLLTAYGADHNAPAAPRHGRTALQAAAASADASIEMIKFLLSQQVIVDAPPARNGGITALQGAAIQGHINIGLLLYENGADVNAMPALVNGRTAIEGAAEHGRLDMVQFLINAGATGDVLEDKGFSPAIDLARKHSHHVVAELLEAHQTTTRPISV